MLVTESLRLIQLTTFNRKREKEGKSWIGASVVAGASLSGYSTIHSSEHTYIYRLYIERKTFSFTKIDFTPNSPNNAIGEAFCKVRPFFCKRKKIEF